MNFKLRISYCLLVSLLLLCTHFAQTQEPGFEFEFGQATTWQNITNESNESSDKLKWLNVNTLDETWSVNGEELIC